MVNKTPEKHQKRDKRTGKFGQKKAKPTAKPKPKTKPRTEKPTRKAKRTRTTKMTKEYLVGGKVIKAKNMADTKGDGVLHLKKRETSRSTKYTWED